MPPALHRRLIYCRSMRTLLRIAKNTSSVFVFSDSRFVQRRSHLFLCVCSSNPKLRYNANVGFVLRISLPSDKREVKHAELTEPQLQLRQATCAARGPQFPLYRWHRTHTRVIRHQFTSQHSVDNLVTPR